MVERLQHIRGGNFGFGVDLSPTPPGAREAVPEGRRELWPAGGLGVYGDSRAEGRISGESGVSSRVVGAAYDGALSDRKGIIALNEIRPKSAGLRTGRNGI